MQTPNTSWRLVHAVIPVKPRAESNGHRSAVHGGGAGVGAGVGAAQRRCGDIVLARQTQAGIVQLQGKPMPAAVQVPQNVRPTPSALSTPQIGNPGPHVPTGCASLKHWIPLSIGHWRSHGAGGAGVGAGVGTGVGAGVGAGVGGNVEPQSATALDSPLLHAQSQTPLHSWPDAPAFGHSVVIRQL